MQFSTLLACAMPALAVAVPSETSGSPTNPTTGLPLNYTWAVENQEAFCYRGGCNFGFNVTGAHEGLYPGFKAKCSGNDSGWYLPCEILNGTSTSGTPSVVASLRPNVENSIATFSVSLRFTDADSGVTFNISGWGDGIYNGFGAAPLQNFTITPSQVTQLLD